MRRSRGSSHHSSKHKNNGYESNRNTKYREDSNRCEDKAFFSWCPV